MSNTTAVGDANFAKEVLESSKPVLVDFWATWCGPCKMIAPVLEEIAKEKGDQIKIVKLDVDEHGATAQKYGVMSIPTLILFKDGEPAKRIVGYKPRAALEAELGLA